MDFLSHIRDQSRRLECRIYVLHLWEELEGNNAETEISAKAITDFNNHLPVLLDQFWEVALEKLHETATLDEIDKPLKIYLLVLIYHCITQSQESVSNKCILHAADIYLLLLTTSLRNEIFKSKLYIAILSTLQSSIEANASEQIISKLMYDLRRVLVTPQLSVVELEVTLATLIHIIFRKTRETLTNFEWRQGPSTLPHEALLSLRVLYDHELLESKKFIIATYLFNGLKKHRTIPVSPRQFSIIQANFRHLLRSLHKKFNEDNYQTFLNAFVHVWSHPDFTFFGEAVIIMNSLKEQYYQTLLDYLKKVLMSEKTFKNIFKFTEAIMCVPPSYVPVEKVKVTNEILVKHILLNCLSKKSEVSSSAIETLAELLMSPDLDKEYIKYPVRRTLNCVNDGRMTLAMMLRGFQSLISKKWGTRSKNKHLFVIVVSVMSLCEEQSHGPLYRKVLECLTEQCSPYDLKPFLPLMSETYLRLTINGFKYSAVQLLKVIFKMALHPMASSAEFVKYLYTAMIYPKVCNGMPIKSDIFIDMIISDDFNFSEFFEKCHTLRLIRYEHATKLLSNLSNPEESKLKLLCAIVHRTEYKELSVIANHINDYYPTICNRPELTYLLYSYNKIFINNNNSIRSDQNLRCNERMVWFIKYHLFRQSLRWNSVANAFALLKTLANFTDLEDDFTGLKTLYDEKLATTMQNRGSYLPFLYYSQLVIFGKKIPNDENLKALNDFLMLCSGEFQRGTPEFNPKVWIGCLLLCTNVCVIKTSMVETALKCLRHGLNCSITVVKLASINMTFDLCNMVTHNFEDLIRYMFKQLVSGDNIFKKTCLLKIDRLIRDDYLKLELEQFLIFVALLANRNLSLSYYAKQLLSESFLISNSTTIARYFVPLVVHITGYKKHPNYTLSPNLCDVVQLVSRNICDRRKMYNLLFTSLPIKQRFSIVYILSTHILESMMKGTIKVDEGFWRMIKDSIYIFKLMTSTSNEDAPGENFYKEVTGHISKYLLQKSDYPDKSLQPEYHKEITKGTEVLLKLLVFNDSDNVQKFICISVFDAIIHWTNFLMADLIHIVHVERNQQIQTYFSKFDMFYKTNGQNLRYAEESFEGGAWMDDSLSCSRSLFNGSEEFMPEFDRV